MVADADPAGIVTLVGQQALTTTQLSLIGLIVAGLTVWVAWRIRRSYTGALVDAPDRARPPFIPPLLPQFLNISITALGSSARRVLLWRLAIPSEF